jgi:hypothetical protein
VERTCIEDEAKSYSERNWKEESRILVSKERKNKENEDVKIIINF